MAKASLSWVSITVSFKSGQCRGQSVGTVFLLIYSIETTALNMNVAYSLKMAPVILASQ